MIRCRGSGMPKIVCPKRFVLTMLYVILVNISFSENKDRTKYQNTSEKLSRIAQKIKIRWKSCQFIRIAMNIENESMFSIRIFFQCYLTASQPVWNFCVDQANAASWHHGVPIKGPRNPLFIMQYWNECLKLGGWGSIQKVGLTYKGGHI